MRIGVFDSGIGGLSVANAIQVARPDLEVIYKNDTAHVPYGSRSAEELLELVTPIMQEFISEGCAVIVVACNTVSTLLAATLRANFAVPFIALEPMVKPAALQTRTKVVAVCATPATLQSPRYAQLKAQFARGIKIIEPDCSDWSSMIEHNQIDDTNIVDRIEQVLKSNADVIVLACTHYHWIEDKITEIAQGRAVVLQPEQAIVRRLQTVIEGLQQDHSSG